MKHFQAIAAMARNRVIGCDNKIPWHLPEDLRFFKAKTIGQTIVMGRRTFESIGRPLPNRSTIVVSRTGFAWPGVRTVASLIEVRPQDEPGEVFVVGGAQIYAAALPLCSDLFLTLVEREVAGEVHFPELGPDFVEVEELCRNPEFSIRHYRNRRLQAVSERHSSG